MPNDNETLRFSPEAYDRIREAFFEAHVAPCEKCDIVVVDSELESVDISEDEEYHCKSCREVN